MIVVFGSISVDIIMNVEKMPQVRDRVLCPLYQLRAGGKGAIQALAAAKTGRSVKLFAWVGDDAFGSLALHTLTQSPLELTHVRIQEGGVTGCALVCRGPQGETMTTIAGGVNQEIKASEVPDAFLSQHTTLLMQMETLPDENWQLIKRAKEFGARIILNLSPACHLSSVVFSTLDVLILNELEASQMALYLGLDVISPTAAGRYMAATYGMSCVIILESQDVLTCSPDGTWKTKGMERDGEKAIGAEDIFIGVLAASLDQGVDLSLALRRAVAAREIAGLKEASFCSFPTENEIEERVKKIPPSRQVM